MDTERPPHPAEHPDPAFPQLHGRPDRGWVNDPNGCSYVHGRFHLFFQYNPDATTHGAIKWGHASSTDLVQWRQEPIALVNRPAELDSYGCWSGCVVDDGGVPTAVYSGVVDDSGRSAVLLARSDGAMRRWLPQQRPAAAMPTDPAVTDVRDPFVFVLDGHRYAVQGAGHRHGSARVLTYGCDDLASWTELGTLLTGEDPLARSAARANIWECPNLVQVDGRWVLLVSLWRLVEAQVQLAGVRWFLGDLAAGPAGLRFSPTAAGELDDGPSFYAPQVLSHAGRVLMWGWSREDGRGQAAVDAAGWAGVLTFARELQVLNNVLVSRPAAELDDLRREPMLLIAGAPFHTPAFEIELDAAAGRFRLSLADVGTEQSVADFEVSSAPVVPPRVLVDGSIVEIFTGGPVARTVRAYPSATSRWVVRTATGTPVRAWRLGLPGH